MGDPIYQKPWIKDHTFYNTQKWDNKKLSSNKIYQFYHKYSDQNRDRIQAMSQQQQHDHELNQQHKKEFHLIMKARSIQRFKNQQKMNQTLKNLSKQNYSQCQLQSQRTDYDSNIFRETSCKQSAKNIDVSNMDVDETNNKNKVFKRVFKLKMSGCSDNKWNDWTNLNQKYTDQVVTQRYIKGNEQAWKNYNSKVQQQQEMQIMQEKQKQINHDYTRIQFQQQILNNFNKNIKINTIKKPSVDHYQLLNYQCQKTNCNENQKQSSVYSKLNQCLNDHFQCLKTKQDSELKGVLIREIDDMNSGQVHNKVIRKMINNSEILSSKLKDQRELQNQSRKQSRQTQTTKISSRSYSNNKRLKGKGCNSDRDDGCQMKEIEKFNRVNQWVNINRYPGLNNNNYM